MSFCTRGQRAPCLCDLPQPGKPQSICGHSRNRLGSRRKKKNSKGCLSRYSADPFLWAQTRKFLGCFTLHRHTRVARQSKANTGARWTRAWEMSGAGTAEKCVTLEEHQCDAPFTYFIIMKDIQNIIQQNLRILAGTRDRRPSLVS